MTLEQFAKALSLTWRPIAGTEAGAATRRSKLRHLYREERLTVRKRGGRRSALNEVPSVSAVGFPTYVRSTLSEPHTA